MSRSAARVVTAACCRALGLGFIASIVTAMGRRSETRWDGLPSQPITPGQRYSVGPDFRGTIRSLAESRQGKQLLLCVERSSGQQPTSGHHRDTRQPQRKGRPQSPQRNTLARSPFSDRFGRSSASHPRHPRNPRFNFPKLFASFAFFCGQFPLFVRRHAHLRCRLGSRPENRDRRQLA